MKKVFSLLAVLAFVVLCGGAAFADIDLSKNAFASFSGEVSFSADLFNWNSTYTGSAAENITWDTSTIELGSEAEQFKCANVYAVISSTLTNAGAKVYIFQDNVNNSSYTATAGRDVGGVTRWDGLVKTGGTEYATLTYMCVKKSSATTNITTLPTAWPSWEPYDGVRRFIDKSNSDWNTQKTGTDVVIANGQGNWIGAGDTEYGYSQWFVKEDVIMFFGAQFGTVWGGDSFGTNTIKFNSSVE